MTGVVRLTLVSHAVTDAMVAERFPADEPINALGWRQLEAMSGLDTQGLAGTKVRQLAGPEQRVYQTAKLLGLQAATEPRLADLDCGWWRGKALWDVRPADLEQWLTEPARAPHGGESILELIDRVGDWLESVEQGPPGDPSRTVAVTHPAVVRAAILLALDVPPTSFWRIDVAPLSRIVLHCRKGRWRLRL
ncbi:histidine phosphatase family protein [Mycobacterium sp. Lab-001]|uniref:histidine phosphatase family protein n=1 Tax=Mycobacterium sp. Lab-001 TaxID=3410136 RepID=UPI003D1865A3